MGCPTKFTIWMAGVGVVRSVLVLSPIWPCVLLPQHCTPPSAVSAQTCELPPAMPVTFVRPKTVTGVATSPGAPSPSAPSSFEPQQRAVPSASAAQVRFLPALMARAELSPMTTAGVSRGVTGLPLLPICPRELSPQQRIEPSASRAQVCETPALIATALARSLTGAGVERDV